jgi:hypothetical protein
MFKNISRRDVGIVTLLFGILIGMAVAVFLRFSLDVKTLDSAIHTACGTGNGATTVSVSWFGKSLDVQCTNGQIIHFNLFQSNKSDQPSVHHHEP